MIAAAGTAVGLKGKRGIEPCAFAEGTYRQLSEGRGLLFLLYFRYFEFPRISLLKLSEKGSERSFDRRFGQYTNAKTARKVPFRCLIRLRFRGVEDFSDSCSRPANKFEEEDDAGNRGDSDNDVGVGCSCSGSGSERWPGPRKRRS